MTGANPHQNVTFTGNGATGYGYLATPASGQGPGVLVIQEWWGLTDHVADVTDRFAAEGFVALAPDLYGGRTTHSSGEAAAMKEDLPVERAARDLSGAIDHLLAHPAVTGTSVGTVGFCMGGMFVLVMAAREGNRVGAAVPFYGLPSIEETDFSHLTAPVLGHYAEKDRSVTPEAVDGLRARITADSEVKPHIHFYPAGHAFFNDSNPSTYHEESARLAWTRTLDFLRTHLS